MYYYHANISYFATMVLLYYSFEASVSRLAQQIMKTQTPMKQSLRELLLGLESTE